MAKVENFAKAGRSTYSVDPIHAVSSLPYKDLWQEIHFSTLVSISSTDAS